MKTFLTLGTTLCFAGALCYGEHFNGKLMDAACYNKDKVATQESGHKTYTSPITKTCAATASTTNFAVRIDDGQKTVVKLDAAGNEQAALAMKNGTLKPDKDGDVHVYMSGKLLGETLQTKWIKANAHGKGVVARVFKRNHKES
jgi:hypothetical protein